MTLPNEHSERGSPGAARTLFALSFLLAGLVGPIGCFSYGMTASVAPLAGRVSLLLSALAFGFGPLAIRVVSNRRACIIAFGSGVAVSCLLGFLLWPVTSDTYYFAECRAGNPAACYEIVKQGTESRTTEKREVYRRGCDLGAVPLCKVQLSEEPDRREVTCASLRSVCEGDLRPVGTNAREACVLVSEHCGQ